MSEAGDRWVERVLGIAVRSGLGTGAASLGAASLAEVRDGLMDAGARLRSVEGAAAGALLRRFAGVQALYKAGDAAGAAAALAAFNDDLAAALPAARAEAAASVSEGSVARGTLRLRLEAAHAALTTNLQGLGARILSVPEVQADPRFGQAKAVLDGLPSLVPGLDAALVRMLGSFDEATDPASRAGLAREAAGLLRQFEALVGSEATLQRMDAFAAAEFGGVPPGAQMRSALDGIASALVP